MTCNLITRRLIEAGALFLIGDGLMGLIKPRRHSLLWNFGPELVRAMSEELADHPRTARSISAAELIAGIALASMQTGEEDN